jgi:hypothetical protein
VNRDCLQVSRSVKGLVAAGMMSAGRQQGKVAVAIELSDQGQQTYVEMLQVGANWELAVGALMVPVELAKAAVAIERLYQAPARYSSATSPPRRRRRPPRSEGPAEPVDRPAKVAGEWLGGGAPPYSASVPCISWPSTAPSMLSVAPAIGRSCALPPP